MWNFKCLKRCLNASFGGLITAVGEETAEFSAIENSLVCGFWSDEFPAYLTL